MALAVVLGAATVASSISLMAASAYLISAAALHPSVAELAIPIVAVRFFGISRGVFRYLERYVSHSINLRLVTQLRVWFYEGLEPLAPARLLEFQSGDLLTRAVSDIETLQDFFVRVVAPPLIAVVIALGLAGWLWTLNPWLVVVLFGAWLIAGVVSPATMGALSRSPARRFIASRAALRSHLVDAIQGIDDVVSFGQGERFRRENRLLTADYARAQSRLALFTSLQNGLGALVTSIAMIAMLALGVVLVKQQSINGVLLAVLALATAASFEAVLPLPHAAQALQTSLQAANRLTALVTAQPAVSDPPHPDSISSPLTLEVRDLVFAYTPSAPPALNGLSFSVPPGRHIGIVGPSGAGKTTLVNLLLRFWDYESGEILLGGAPIKHLAQADIRSIIGVISQSTYLFGATIRENLLIAKPDSTPEEIDQAIRSAKLARLVTSLPKGLDTWVGERGVALSGGERQRLAVARVLLRGSRILVLDEPTANLDHETERELLRSILRLMQGRTLLLVTHRLVEMEALDEILVMDRGCIVERGTHSELLARRGLYRRLWDLQNLPLEAETER